MPPHLNEPLNVLQNILLKGTGNYTNEQTDKNIFKKKKQFLYVVVVGVAVALLMKIWMLMRRRRLPTERRRRTLSSCVQDKSHKYKNNAIVINIKRHNHPYTHFAVLWTELHIEWVASCPPTIFARSSQHIFSLVLCIHIYTTLYILHSSHGTGGDSGQKWDTTFFGYMQVL